MLLRAPLTSPVVDLASPVANLASPVMDLATPMDLAPDSSEKVDLAGGIAISTRSGYRDSTNSASRCGSSGGTMSRLDVRPAWVGVGLNFFIFLFQFIELGKSDCLH